MAHALAQKTLPKQAEALLTGTTKVSTYEATGGKITHQFAHHNLTLLPLITPGSIIHDNCAGAGTVTRLLLAHNPDVLIHATDTDQPFLDALAADAARYTWPVHVSNQRSEKTTFPDDFFDLDITNIGIIFWGGAGLDGAREVYRTLKPGGTAVLNCWASITWLQPVIQVHEEFRPDVPFPVPRISWSDGQQLRKVLLEAGFDEGKMRLERQEVEAVVKEDEFRAWCEKTWAYLGGIGGWQEGDGERWDEEVGRLEERLREAGGTRVEGGYVRMGAGQWVAVVEK